MIFPDFLEIKQAIAKDFVQIFKLCGMHFELKLKISNNLELMNFDNQMKKSSMLNLKFKETIYFGIKGGPH